MIFLRRLLTAILMLTLFGLPVLVPGFGSYAGRLDVRAAPHTTVALDNHNGNTNHNDNWDNENWNHNDNWDNENWNQNDNDDNSNDNDDNSNDNNDDDDDDDNDNWDRGWPDQPPPPPPPPPGVVSYCYAAGESGPLGLELPGGTVTLTVVSASTFPRSTQVSLVKLDASSTPGTPGARLDEIVFELRAREGCDGNTIGELPADANLGLSYSVAASSSSLTFAVWDGSSWLTVPTIADPNPANPYISATVRRTGTYTVYQAR